MHQVIRTAARQMILLGAAATVACTAAATNDDDVSSSSAALTSGPCGGHVCYDDIQPPTKPDPCVKTKTCGGVVTPPAKIACGFSPSCPPGEYNTTANGYVLTPGAGAGSISGCSVTPPTTCETGTAGATVFPAFAAPVITSVVVAGNTVFGIGAPSTPITSQPNSPTTAYTDKRTAVYAWGDNSSYQLGDGTRTASTTPQVPMYDPVHPVTQIAAGAMEACALLSDGTVHCWGTTSFGAIHPTQVQVQFPAGVQIAQITHGKEHACALSTGTTPTVYCWGDNSYSQLGQTTTSQNYIGGPLAVPLTTLQDGTPIGPIVSVVASGNSTCVLATDPTDSTGTNKNVFCWGDNTKGSLGNAAGGPGNTSVYPVQAAFNDPGLGIPLPFGTALVGANVGGQGQYGSFCSFVTSSNTWVCWGADDEGQIDLPTQVSNIADDGDPGYTAPTPVQGPSISNAPAFALGTDHGCAPSPTTGSLWCFGSNDEGQLGVSTGMGTGSEYLAVQVAAPPAGIPSFTAAAAGTNMTCGIYVAPGATPSYGTATGNGNLACWGGDNPLVNTYSPTFLTW